MSLADCSPPPLLYISPAKIRDAAAILGKNRTFKGVLVGQKSLSLFVGQFEQVLIKTFLIRKRKIQSGFTDLSIRTAKYFSSYVNVSVFFSHE